MFYNQIIFLFSFTKLLLQREELEQKHLHLLQIVESEKTAKWQYMQQCEELAAEIKKLRAEVSTLYRELLLHNNTEDIIKFIAGGFITI